MVPLAFGVFATVNVASSAPVHTSVLPWVAACPDYGPKAALAQTHSAPLLPSQPVPVAKSARLRPERSRRAAVGLDENGG